MEMINTNAVPQLKEFAKTNELGKEVFEALAVRERAAARSDVDAIFRELEAKHKKELNYFKFLDVWKMLEDSGYGTLVYGRKGNPNRFVWNTNFKHLGRMALGLPKEELPPMKQKRSADIKSSMSSTITFVIPPTVSKEDIMALVSLGSQLSTKENKK